MTAIEVPYMPIDKFDDAQVAKNFEEVSEEEIQEIDKILSLVNPNNERSLPEDMLLILIGMGMEKYIELFEEHCIPLDTFLHLTEKDLVELEITDPKDREIILKNLLIHNPNKTSPIIPYNQNDDLKIVQNVTNHLKVMQKYCEYVELQMRRQTWTDYTISTEESACTYLKAFTDCALTQANILKLALYDEKNMDGLINKSLKMNHLVLPPGMQKTLQKLNKKKRNWKPYTLKVLTLLGFSSLVLIGGNYLYFIVKSSLKIS